MRSTLAQPGSARPITVLLELILFGAGGAMAQNATNYDDGDPHNPDPNLANQVCCDPDSGSRSSAPTTIACTDYPTGRVGRYWSGQTACLSAKNGGYPKTAAGCASLNVGDDCLPFGEANTDAYGLTRPGGHDGGKCEEDLDTSGNRCFDGDACWTYPYLVCVGSSPTFKGCEVGLIIQGFSSNCPDGTFCCGAGVKNYCMPGALFPGDHECQDYAGLVGLIIGICCVCGGLAYLRQRQTQKARKQRIVMPQAGYVPDYGQAAAAGNVNLSTAQPKRTKPVLRGESPGMRLSNV